MFARLASGLFALYLGVAAVLAVDTAYTRLQENLPHLGDDPPAARRRVFGDPYTEAIEGIRRALPPGSVYVLINANDKDEGFPLWVRYDLAPHRAIFLGRLSQLPGNIRRAFPRGDPPVVLTYGAKEPPRLIDRREFLDWFETPGRTGPPEKEIEGESAPRRPR